VHPYETNPPAGVYEAKLETILDAGQYASLLQKARPPRLDIPHGWLAGGGASRDCRIEQDTTTVHNGRASVRSTCTGYDARGFEVYNSGEGLLQEIRADAYRGKRIRLSAWVKPYGVEQSARLWMRVDAADRMLCLDNMERNLIKGTSDWQKREVVLDVPTEAIGISIGLILNGKGTIWADDFQLETVSLDVPSTDIGLPQRPWDSKMREQMQERYSRAPEQPVNLNFEEGSSQGPL